MALHLTCGSMQLSSSGAALARPSQLPRARLVAARRPLAAHRLVVRASVGQYLAEAAAAIFSPKPTNEPPNWSGTGFTGEIAHHSEVAKLRKLHSAVKATRQQVAGCMDATASNYNPDAAVDDGTCEYIISEPGKEQYKGTLGSYISEALASVFGDNFHSRDSSTAANFEHTSFSYDGDIISQRDIQRLLHFEKVVKKTLDHAENQVEEA